MSNGCMGTPEHRTAREKRGSKNTVHRKQHSKLLPYCIAIRGTIYQCQELLYFYFYYLLLLLLLLVVSDNQ